MPSPLKSIDEFIDKVWPHHEAINQAGTFEDRTGCIYGFYNHSMMRANPNFQATFSNIAQALNRAGAFTFDIQRTDITGTGSDFATAFATLRDLTEPNMYHAYRRATNPTNRPRKPYPWQRKAKAAYRAELEEIEWFRALRDQVAIERLRDDPAAILGRFLYHTVGNGAPDCLYRVYITPTLQQTAKVYAELIYFMHRLFNMGDNVKPLRFDTPRPLEAKMTLPAADENLRGKVGTARSDRIVVYCQTQAEMQITIDWLRRYQEDSRGLFDTISPRGTKPVNGLNGVSVANEPDPEDAFNRDTGMNSWSFGLALSALIAMALRLNPETVEEAKHTVRRLAEIYKHDLQLHDVQVT